MQIPIYEMVSISVAKRRERRRRRIGNSVGLDSENYGGDDETVVMGRLRITRSVMNQAHIHGPVNTSDVRLQ